MCEGSEELRFKVLRSEEHTSELQSQSNLVCRLLLEKKNQIYEGKVARLMDFGAFLTILPGRDGLVHISQISNERVERVIDKLKEGDLIRVKVLEVDRQGRIRLSMRDLDS